MRSFLFALLLASLVLCEPAPLEVEGSGTYFPGYNSSYSISPSGGFEGRFDLSAVSQSQAWAGFYGNISSLIVLKDLSGDGFFEWSEPVLSGQVFASTSSSPDWSSLGADVSAVSVDSLWGFGSWADNASSSFVSDSNTEFEVGSNAGPVTIAAGTRNSLNTSSTGAGVFEEVLLADSFPVSSKENLVFACLVNGLQESFKGGSAHFQMILPNNQVNASSLDTYYFYAQIE